MTRKNRFPNYSIPQITDEDVEAVATVLRKNEWLAGNGPVTRQFEEAIAEYTGYEFSIAVNSATSGLFVAYSVMYGKKSLTIHVPALTFVATANMLLATNTDIKIIDVDSKTWTDTKIKEVPVSFAGYPTFGGEVADDAHFLNCGMVQYDHDISVISTHAVKHVTSGEGGVILTNDEYLYREMSKLVDQGRGVGNSQFGWGYNFRMPDMNAALALSQLKRHPENLAHKRQLAHEYYRLLKGSPLTLPPYHKDHAWHLFVVLVPDRQLGGIVQGFADTFGLEQDKMNYRNIIVNRLKRRGINTGHHYPPLYTYQHLAQYKAEQCPVSEMAWNRGISLPLYPDMTLEDVAYVSENLLGILND